MTPPGRSFKVSLRTARVSRILKVHKVLTALRHPDIYDLIRIGVCFKKKQQAVSLEMVQKMDFFLYNPIRVLKKIKVTISS